MAVPIDARGQVDVRRGGSRYRTRLPWLDSRHSFSFGPHFNPANTGHGKLVVSNDDWVRAGTGFTTHPHRDMEIVTWVVEGALEHKDSTGTTGVIYPGLAQRMSAGRGILHSEMNASRAEDVRFVQMWIVPDAQGVEPSYEQADVTAELASGGLVLVAAGGRADAAISIRRRGAALRAGKLPPGASVELPDARFVHLFVVRGAVDLEGGAALVEGDAARLVGAGARAMAVTGTEGAEVLVWATD